MRTVQLLFTESQVSLLAGAVSNARIEALQGDNELEQRELTQLLDFLYVVEAQPEKFPIRTQGLARSLKKRTRGFDGPAQPPRNPNQRKRAQLRAQGSQKRTRAENRRIVAEFNATRDAYVEAVKERDRKAAELAAANEPVKRKLIRIPTRRAREQ